MTTAHRRRSTSTAQSIRAWLDEDARMHPALDRHRAARPGARRPDSFESWDTPVDRTGVSEAYLAELRAAEEKSGVDESVLTGRGLVRGRPVAVVVNEFRFLAGSIGRAAADRIIAAVRRATAEGLPLLGHHGLRRHPHAGGHPGVRADGRDLPRADGPPGRRAALPRHLRHPTTGGVFASWGSLGHVTVAEPGGADRLPRAEGLRGR